MSPTEPERRQDTPRERFARAVEHSRPPEPGDGEPEDGLAAFDTELAIVARLRRTPTPGPDAATKQRIYERIRHELDAQPATARPRTGVARNGSRKDGTGPANRGDAARPAGLHGIRRRLAVSVAALLCLFAVLGGLSMLLARDALPGDTLYDVRRLTEQAQLQMTIDPTDRATAQLGFATERLRDMSALHAAGAGAQDFRIALDDFDADTVAGARLLNTLGTSSSAGSFTELRDWVNASFSELNQLAGKLPAGLGDRVHASTALLGHIQDRINLLSARLSCASITSGLADRIGPLPASSHDCPAPNTRTNGPKSNNAPDPADRANTSTGPQPKNGGGQAPGKPAQTRRPNTTTAPPRQHRPTTSPVLPLPTDRPLLPPTHQKQPKQPKGTPLITVPPMLGLPRISIG